MKIRASVQSGEGQYQVRLQTGEHVHSIEIPPKGDGSGASVNGGELLSLALATCYCNDLYREAGKRGVKVESVEVEVESDFEAEGAAAKSIVFRARVAAQAGEDEIRALMKDTDRVSEIQNTVRAGTPVILKDLEVIRR